MQKKRPGPSELRARQINNIKQSNNVPVLAFTHPRDKWEGLLSDWLEEVQELKGLLFLKIIRLMERHVLLKEIIGKKILQQEKTQAMK